MLAGTGFFLLVFGVLDLYRFFVLLFLVVSTIAIDCLERLVSEMTCYVSSGMLNPTLTHACGEVQIVSDTVSDCMQTGLIGGRHQLNLEYQLSVNSLHIITALYTVNLKNTPNVFYRIFHKNWQILINFGVYCPG